MPDTLLAALTFRLSSHPENIATEALWHVLRTHHSSGDALLSLLGNAGLPKLGALTFRTQVYGLEGSIPDLVGCDANGQEILILEAKFWAHLTDNQPSTYLARLESKQPSILLFVCPETRLETLWGLLKGRVKDAGVELSVPTRSSFLTWSCVDTNRNLAIVSWRSILKTLCADAIALGDRQYQSDAEQLQGLCDRMDAEAFLPFRSDDFSQEIGRRVVQLAMLVDDTVAFLARTDANISTKGMTTGRSQSTYGRYFKYRNKIGAFLHYSPTLWAKTGVSPIWLQLWDGTTTPDWSIRAGIADLLRIYTSDAPTSLTEISGAPAVAVSVPHGKEEEEVIQEIARQVIAALEAVAPY